MGWERKRGKLQELNRLLARRDDHEHPDDRRGRRRRRPPTCATSSPSTPTPGCRAARSGAGRHDRPPAQPGRASIRSARPGRRRATASSSRASRRRCRPSTRPRSSSASSPGRRGIDPYASAVSDVYQDLFGEGSFTGKGIYDVDAFEAALADRVPENTLLSHDLFEGIFARAGLVTDVELFEEFPSHYLVAAAAPAPLGARRLAAAAVDPRPGARRDRAAPRGGPRHRPLEDVDNLRRTLSAPADARDARRRLDAAAASRPASWTAFVLAPLIVPAGAARPRRAAAAPAAASPSAATCAASAPTSPLAAAQVGLRRHVPRPPGVADGRRDRAHARPALRHARGTCSNG